jgi:NAD(P)-dependent dehydrogenase (short-subunit alcohol dehydrogenase family)
LRRAAVIRFFRKVASGIGKIEEFMASKVWFITGSSKGFGRVWAEAALARGDRVAATARDIDTLSPLTERYGKQVAAITLDVTNKAKVDAAIAEAHAQFGRLDVVVNNAGYGLFGTIEEVSEDEARAQIETNLFGALWVIQAALPIMRAQGSGHIIQVSSIGGVNAFPTIGLSHASKWGLEGFSQALAAEVAGFGIKVTIVEPGGYATDWGGKSAIRASAIPAYDAARAKIAEFRSGNVPGDPQATGPAILKVVDAQDPPLRIFFGAGGLPMTRAEYGRRIETWEKWNAVSVEAQGTTKPAPR